MYFYVGTNKYIYWRYQRNYYILFLVNTAFSISGTVMNGMGSTGTDVSSACANDWITIPCATNSFKQDKQINGVNSMGPDTCVDRICGMVFNSVIQTDIATARTQPVNSKYQFQSIKVQILWSLSTLSSFLLYVKT